MKANIQIFTSDIFGEIRTCQVNNQIMFVGKDVATALGYSKPENAIATHVDTDDKTTTPIQGTGSNSKPKFVIINESGLNSLILPPQGCFWPSHQVICCYFSSNS